MQYPKNSENMDRKNGDLRECFIFNTLPIMKCKGFFYFYLEFDLLKKQYSRVWTSCGFPVQCGILIRKNMPKHAHKKKINKVVPLVATYSDRIKSSHLI